MTVPLILPIMDGPEIEEVLNRILEDLEALRKLWHLADKLAPGGPGQMDAASAIIFLTAICYFGAVETQGVLSGVCLR